jgi:hypothetical protein
MTRIAYTVRATLPDKPVADEYIAWLQDGHIQAVIKGGAASAEIVQITDPAAPIRVEARYIFQDRAALDRYFRDSAPALRAEGLAKFPPSRGIALERMIGQLV